MACRAVVLSPYIKECSHVCTADCKHTNIECNVQGIATFSKHHRCADMLQDPLTPDWQ